MRYWLLIFTFLPFIAQAEIYKCEVDGKVSYSDEPCGSSAEKIEVKVSPSTGTRLTTESMDKLSDELHQDRRKRELDADIERQYKKIEKLASDYQRNLNDLRDQLAQHESRYDYAKFKSHPHKSRDFREKKVTLKNKIKETKQKYKIDKRLAYDKLNRLKQQRRELRYH